MDLNSKMTELDDAIASMLACIEPLTQTEVVKLQQAHGRVLAQDVCSALSVPSFDNSAMDGYALRHIDLARADIESGKQFVVSQRIPAGSQGTQLQTGTVARIFTGAPVPAGADVVIQQEHAVVSEDGMVSFNKWHPLGDNLRKAGEDIQAGDVVLPVGRRLGTAEIGVAASVGQAELVVFKRPKVALFVTGDELTEPGQALRSGGIYNSNRYVLGDLLRQMQCDTSDLGVVEDNLQAVQDKLAQAALEHDLILTSGGVSVGEEDHVKNAVSHLGELTLWKLAMKPGKPLAFGRIKRSNGKGYAWFIGLPGNPVATFVTFLMVAKPFLQKLGGQSVTSVPCLPLKAGFSAQTKNRREFWRARVNAQGSVELYPNQSSGVLTSMVWAQGFIDVPANTQVNAGDTVKYISLADLCN